MAVTIVDIARLAGVSDATVSLVLSGKDLGRVSAKRREQILKIAREQGYRPNMAARGLVQQRHFRVAVCFDRELNEQSPLGNPSLFAKMALASRRLLDAGYAIELREFPRDAAVREVNRELGDLSVDAVLFNCWATDRALPHMKYLKKRGVPSGLCAETPTAAPFVSAWTDMDAILTQAMDYLRQAGCQRLALLLAYAGMHEHTFSHVFDKNLKEWGIEGVIVRRSRRDWNVLQEVTRAAASELPGVDGMILYDSTQANAVLGALEELGRVPGKDVRLVGIGSTASADMARPRVTHVAPDFPGQVGFVIDGLLRLIDNPDAPVGQEAFHGLIVERET